MDIEGNPLVEGKQYIIGLKNNSKRYIGKYVRQDEDEDELIFNMVYELNKNSPPIPFSRGEYSFSLDNVRLATPEYFKNLKQSVLGKNKRQDEQEQEEKRFKEEDDQYTAEEIEEDKKFWESVDGGSTRKGYKGSKRKSKKRKSKRNKRKSKRRKSNNSI